MGRAVLSRDKAWPVSLERDEDAALHAHTPQGPAEAWQGQQTGTERPDLTRRSLMSLHGWPRGACVTAAPGRLCLSPHRAEGPYRAPPGRAAPALQGQDLVSGDTSPCRGPCTAGAQRCRHRVPARLRMELDGLRAASDPAGLSQQISPSLPSGPPCGGIQVSWGQPSGRLLAPPPGLPAHSSLSAALAAFPCRGGTGEAAAGGEARLPSRCLPCPVCACSPWARWLGCFLGHNSAKAACDVSPSPRGGLLIFAP